MSKETEPIQVNVDDLARIAKKYNVKIDFEIKEDGGCEVWIEPLRGARQHIQSVESVGNNDDIIVRSNLEPLRGEER